MLLRHFCLKIDPIPKLQVTEQEQNLSSQFYIVCQHLQPFPVCNTTRLLKGETRSALLKEPV